MFADRPWNLQRRRQGGSREVAEGGWNILCLQITLADRQAHMQDRVKGGCCPVSCLEFSLDNRAT